MPEPAAGALRADESVSSQEPEPCSGTLSAQLHAAPASQVMLPDISKRT